MKKKLRKITPEEKERLIAAGATVKKVTEKEVDNVNDFVCTTCAKPENMSLDQFKEHLKTVHDVDPNILKGKRQMVLHMDGDTWFSSVYNWTLESGITFQQSIVQKRKRPFYQ